MGEPFTFKFRAFLSYSHHDQSWGKRIHAALEAYHIDKGLVGKPTSVGPVPKTLRPIFRDREDFSAGHSLTAQTLAALEASQFLVVLCSPHAAQSKYVNEEIRRFKMMGRGAQVIPIIIDGEPGDPVRECFPAALRLKANRDGTLTDELEEPISADARPQGDGKYLAIRKVVAGLLGISLDEILRRAERTRRRRNQLWGALSASFLFLAILAGGSAVYAYNKLLESDDRLDKAIELAYGFVAEAASVSDRFGVPVEVSFALLSRAEAAINGLISQGADTVKLRYRKALMLSSFATIYDTLGKTSDGLRCAREERDILKGLVVDYPDNREWMTNLSLAHFQVGIFLMIEKSPVAALESFRESLAIFEKLSTENSNDVNLLAQKAQVTLFIGDAMAEQGLLKQAVARYLLAMDLITGFGTDRHFPNIDATINSFPMLRPYALDVLTRLAYQQGRLGHYVDSMTSYQLNLQIRKGIVHTAPNSTSVRIQLLDAFRLLGDAYYVQSLLDEAMETFQQGFDLATKMFASDANNVGLLRQVALFRDGIGRVLLMQGKTTEALDTFRANFVSAESSTIADRENTLWQSYIGIGHERIADALFVRGDHGGALVEYQAERSIISRLVEANAATEDFRTRLAICDFKIGEVLRAQGRRDESIEHFRASLGLRERAATAQPNVVINQIWLWQARWRVAEASDDVLVRDAARSNLNILRTANMLDPENLVWLAMAQEDLPLVGSVGSVSAIAVSPFSPGCNGKDADVAITACTELINRSGEDSQTLSTALKVRGDAYRTKGQFENAIADYNEAIHFEPAQAALYNNRALAFNSRGEHDRAISDLNEAIRLNPLLAIAYGNRGLAYDGKGQSDRALIDYGEAIRLDPNNFISRYNRGVCLGRLGRLDEAINDLTKAIRLNPTFASAYVDRGFAYISKGQLDDAIADLNHAIRLEPKRTDVYNVRGVAFFKENRLQEALADFSEALRLDPFNAIGYTNRGRVYEHQGQFDLAIAEHDAAIRLNPQLAIAYANRALAYEGKGQRDQAIIDFEAALRIDPKLDRAIEGRNRILTISTRATAH